MADLNILADSLGVKIDCGRPLGKKRRSWLVDNCTLNNTNENNRVYKPNNEMGSINPVDQPILNGSINPVDQPHSNKWVDQPIYFSFQNLRGNPLKLIQYFFELSNNDPQKRTSKITRSKIKKDLNISIDSVKTALKFLLKNKLIKIVFSMKGRSGYSSYKLKDSLFEEVASAYKIGSINRVYISSSSYINTTTMTSLDNKGGKDTDSLSSQPPSVNISPLTSIGLTYSHVLQLTTNNKLTVEQIQDSINFFAFDLTHNDKARALKKTPLDFFMGILRQGHPYAAPANYESPEAQALRLYLESKQRLSQFTAELETKVKAELFQEWQASLTAQELEAFYVENGALDGLSENLRGSLRRRHALDNARQYFSTEIWPEKRQQILEEKLNLAEKCPDGD